MVEVEGAFCSALQSGDVRSPGEAAAASRTTTTTTHAHTHAHTSSRVGNVEDRGRVKLSPLISKGDRLIYPIFSCKTTCRLKKVEGKKSEAIN